MSSNDKQRQLLINPMSADDIAAVYEIEQRAYKHGWTEGILKDCLKTAYICKTVWLEEQLVGYGIISIAAGEAHLLNLTIAPEFQRQGFGRSVLHYFLELVQQSGTETMFLEVRDSNRSAIALYLDEGFNQIGIRNDYYPAAKGHEDAIIMALSLNF